MATPEELKQFGEKLQQSKSEIAAKSFTDSGFRAQLLADPRGTVEKEYGLPEGTWSDLNINIVEENSGEIVLPIPAADLELTEDQLELVAGGVAFIGALIGTVVTAAATVAVAGIKKGW